MKKIVFITYILAVIIFNSCTIEAPTPKLNPPMGLRILTSTDIASITASPFNMDGGKQTDIDNYDSAINPYYAGDGYTTPSGMTGCVAIEFYAYNTEQYFNGYNVYVVTDGGWGDAQTARSSILADLKLYQIGQNDNDIGTGSANKPVEPGNIANPYAATISNVYFSGGVTRFVVVINQECDNGTKILSHPLNINSWIVVTAVSLTSDSLNESEPSNAVQIP